ncbi:MAG: DUF1214 domain-containing protein [Pseudolabrys sp.]|nr:DUF1214 domain-containing protein [Pseudolabrys sp.]MDP2298066.1 DUF1214 domain-containing protein [Pseudolabrys sp.]
MRLLIGTLFALAVAAAVGLGATYLALTRGAAFGALTIGSWTAWPKTGTADADPYARATIARTGQLPVALGDGVSFTAQTDDSGKVLDGRCDIVLSGVTPAARFWTLTLYNAEGGLVTNSVERYGFSSQEIVRHADGSFEIVVGPRANPGNWLPTGGIERYALVLRFYDTAVGISTKAGRELPMPAITSKGCP